MKVNIGCGKNLLDGYVNIDMDPIDDSVIRGTLTQIPLENNSADEILAEHIFEHLDFAEEKLAWSECKRILKPGGSLVMEVPDFEWICEQFLRAQDDFTEFYEVGAVDHYFGNGKNVDQRWSILTTMFFGNQNGPGQYHKTAYTEKKIEAIGRKMGFIVNSVNRYTNKGGQAIRVTLTRTE